MPKDEKSIKKDAKKDKNLGLPPDADDTNRKSDGTLKDKRRNEDDSQQK
jgi:hypothetical protein